jgi:hypothetical protein
MLNALFHRLLFPTLVATVIGTVWVVGWSQALVAEVDRGSWPALPTPHHVAQLSALPTHPR